METHMDCKEQWMRPVAACFLCVLIPSLSTGCTSQDGPPRALGTAYIAPPSVFDPAATQIPSGLSFSPATTSFLQLPPAPTVTATAYARFAGMPVRCKDHQTFTLAAGGVSILVQSGDTLYGLAQCYGTTIGVIQADNSLTSEKLHPDQILRLRRAPRDF